MALNRTVLRKGQPRFAIGEVGYARASVLKGFMEPLKIAGVKFDPARNEWLYSWSRDLRLTNTTLIAPVEVFEDELLTLCEALPIQLDVLERELAEMQSQFAESCPGGAVTTTSNTSETDPPAPLFGYNEIVYLRETAEVLGRMEAFRITDYQWSTQTREWTYIMHIRRRPGRNMTVGNRIDMTREFDLVYPENQLCPLCEAIPLALTFLNRAVSQTRSRISSLCPGIQGTT